MQTPQVRQMPELLAEIPTADATRSSPMQAKTTVAVTTHADGRAYRAVTVIQQTHQQALASHDPFHYRTVREAGAHWFALDKAKVETLYRALVG